MLKESKKINLTPIIIAVITVVGSISGAFISSRKSTNATLDKKEVLLEKLEVGFKELNSKAGQISNDFDKISARLSYFPVGTIISSMLDPVNFARAVGDPLNFDPNTSKWVAADEETKIPGTKYAELTGNREIPDLQGMFLRGLNNFGTNGRADEFRDIDGYRDVGGKQGDATRIQNDFNIPNHTVFTLSKGQRTFVKGEREFPESASYPDNIDWSGWLTTGDGS